MKIFLIFLSLVLCGFKCNKEQKATIIDDFSKHVRIEPHFDTKTQIVKINVSLDENIHAYGEGETIGRPVNLVIEASGNYHPEGPLNVPKSTLKKFPSGEYSHVLEGNFSVEQKVSAGKGPLKSTFFLQVCSDYQCDRPRSYDFSW